MKKHVFSISSANPEIGEYMKEKNALTKLKNWDEKKDIAHTDEIGTKSDR